MSNPVSRRQQPAILFVTGASGSGKTTLVKALAARGRIGVRCYFFDSIGVPTPAEMDRDFGSGEAWQADATRRWVEALAAETPAGAVSVLDGQIRPSTLRKLLARFPDLAVDIVLIDCSSEERRRRLRESRGQPDLATPEMDAWAAYLRGQADALELAVIDTTAVSVDEALDRLEVRVLELQRLAPS
jgi:molybdopterin-guanine dinucleotide biosynthesis protein